MTGQPKLTPAQRSAAVDRAGESIALRSGAGCGKTYVLARRFTELLLNHPEAENPLSYFVALTFTEKAALEMSQRIGRILSDIAAGSKGESRRRVRSWIERLPEARISTIHGFCASLLRTYAVEAGVDPSFAVCADELLAGQMRLEAAEQAVLSGVESQHAGVAGLLGGVRFDLVVEQVVELIEARTSYDAAAYADAPLTLRRWSEQVAAERREAFERLGADEDLRREVEELAASPCGDPSDKLLAYRDEKLAVIQALLRDAQSGTPEDFALLNDKPGNVGSNKAWGGKGAAKEMRDRLKSVIQTVAEYAMYAEDVGDPDAQSAAALATLTELAAEANGIYAAAKRARGMLDFTDLIEQAYRLLKDNPSVRRSLSGQIDQLLIDECQDTDAFQVALLNLLVCDGGKGPVPRDGKLFVVGDAKQSIYRFRGAQVEVFSDLCSRLGPDRQEELSVSFRTHAAGAAFVNHLFAPMMGPEYAGIEARRKTVPAHPSVEIILSDGDGEITDAAGASKAQAGATVRRIAEMLETGERLVWDDERNSWRPVRAGDIAILFARMTSSLDYERALAREGVPYYVVGGSGFFRRQEVFDVLNALDAIDDPFNDVALMGVLRSAIFALDDNVLMHVAEQFEPPYFEKLLAALGPEASDGSCGDGVGGLCDADTRALRFAVGLIDRLHRDKDAVGIDALIERLLDAVGYEAVLLSQFQGRRMLGNVRRLLDQARTAAAEGASLADFLVRMGDLVMNESRYEQAAVAGESEDVVRLMTIHKAKGLEFPVVFVPDLNAVRRGFRGSLLNRLDWGLTYKIEAEEETDEDATKNGERQGREPQLPLSFRLARRREERDLRAEDVRVLYVAATRHEDHLVFVGANQRTKDGAFTRRNSYLWRMDAVLGISAAVDAERESIPYADGQYAASLRRMGLRKPAARGRSKLPGRKLLDEADSPETLAEGILALGRRSLSGSAGTLIGPLATSVGRVELAVTALNEFQRCPMLYHWRYELGAPVQNEGFTGHDSQSAVPGDLAPAVKGTLFHRCMQLLDFSGPLESRPLLQTALAEMHLSESVDLAALEDELGGMLADFARRPLFRQIAEAGTVSRELDFMMSLPSAVLRGQIDVLYEDSAGGWHVVDYKSDRVDAEGIAERAAGYELQLLLYAAAAARYLHRPYVEARLYFLRPAVEHAFAVTPEALAAVESRAAKLCAEIVSARRKGAFRPAESDRCAFCPYRSLCRTVF